MARLILLGKRGNASEIIKIADESKDINEITKIKKQIATDKCYKDFTSVQIWDAQGGLGWSLKLSKSPNNPKPKPRPVVKEEPKKAVEKPTSNAKPKK